MNKVPLPVRRLAANGLGNPWMAECLRPWTPGDPTCATYIYARKGNPACFYLEPNKIYLCQEPAWKRLADDEAPLGEDDQIEVRRFYVRVDTAGKVNEITNGEAEERLRALCVG